MTREQARREIDSLDFYLQNHTDDYGEESHTAMMMAIEALSSSEKPNKWVGADVLNHWIGAEVLDKIRAEIEALPKTYPFVNHQDMYVKEEDVRKIIDKYIAEGSK